MFKQLCLELFFFNPAQVLNGWNIRYLSLFGQIDHFEWAPTLLALNSKDHKAKSNQWKTKEVC